MNLFEEKEKDEKPSLKKQDGKKVKVVNVKKDVLGNIVELIVDNNGNGQRVPYKKNIHGEIEIGITEINL